MIYLGLTGRYGCGKDTVAQILQDEGFIHLSLSEVLREYLRSQNIPLTRENLIKYGDQMREEFGPDVLSQRCIAKLKPNHNYVFSSIRSLGELRRLQTLPGFQLIEVVAPIDVRLARLQQRNREHDPKTKSELLHREQQEQTSDPSGMQLSEVIAQARYQILNDSTVEVLQTRTKELLRKVTTSKN